MERAKELANIISDGMGKERLQKELEDSQFGNCVFDTDNDVVDNQISSIEFENGVTATFILNAFSNEISRSIQLLGTEGELRGDTFTNRISYIRFKEDSEHHIILPESKSGHGGGDFGLVRDFVQMVRTNSIDGPSSARISLMSHIMAFAAEESRINKKIIDINDFMKE
jgi:predicted dehydrogenase